MEGLQVVDLIDEPCPWHIIAEEHRGEVLSYELFIRGHKFEARRELVCVFFVFPFVDL